MSREREIGIRDVIILSVRIATPATPAERERDTRHNAVRDVIAEYEGEAGKKWRREQSFAQLARMTGRGEHAVTTGDATIDMDGEDDATNNANGERPCDIVIIHRISDAPHHRDRIRRHDGAA